MGVVGALPMPPTTQLDAPGMPGAAVLLVLLRDQPTTSPSITVVANFIPLLSSQTFCFSQAPVFCVLLLSELPTLSQSLSLAYFSLAWPSPALVLFLLSTAPSFLHYFRLPGVLDAHYF